MLYSAGLKSGQRSSAPGGDALGTRLLGGTHNATGEQLGRCMFASAPPTEGSFFFLASGRTATAHRNLSRGITPLLRP